MKTPVPQNPWTPQFPPRNLPNIPHGLPNSPGTPQILSDTHKIYFGTPKSLQDLPKSTPGPPTLSGVSQTPLDPLSWDPQIHPGRPQINSLGPCNLPQSLQTHPGTLQLPTGLPQLPTGTPQTTPSNPTPKSVLGPLRYNLESSNLLLYSAPNTHWDPPTPSRPTMFPPQNPRSPPGAPQDHPLLPGPPLNPVPGLPMSLSPPSS